MHSRWGGLIEFGVVAAFALAWAVVEIVASRYDRKRPPDDAGP